MVVSLQLRFFSGEFQRPGWPQLESVEGTFAAMKNYMWTTNLHVPSITSPSSIGGTMSEFAVEARVAVFEDPEC